MNEFPYGFRVVGSPFSDRISIDWQRAFNAHCQNDERAETGRESYLSLFTFGDEFREHLERTGSTKNYRGPCWSPWVWWDIDAEGDLPTATDSARRLAAYLADRFGSEPLLFFSGSKGYHVGIPTSLFEPEPSATFHRITRRFAETIAATLGIEIDAGIYDKVRLFRAPNSTHPKTRFHKRRLTLRELLHLKPSAIVQMAEKPESFEPPDAPPLNSTAVDDWRQAAETVERELREHPKRLAGTAWLNRSTLAFIRDGAPIGDRHRVLFSAAANLAEFGCPPQLAYELLAESALDCGLPPSETRRQIDCGLSHGRDSTQAASVDESIKEQTEAATGDSRPSESMLPTPDKLAALGDADR